jgi:hypothetical protein
MSRRYISVAEQSQIIERADKRCEYCQSCMDYSSQSFAIEHVLPVALGGKTTLENLALACGGCNGHKYTKVEAFDALSQIIVPLYNPRKQKWCDHFVWSSDRLQMVGQTASGRATVDALKLNRVGVINIRKLLMMVGHHPPE